MEENKLNLEVKPEVAHGCYSNLAIISHSRSEFVIDFAAVLPGLKADVGSRIIMAPEHVKRLVAALSDNLAKYESTFGPIKIEDGPRGTYNLTDLNPNGTRS